VPCKYLPQLQTCPFGRKNAAVIDRNVISKLPEVAYFVTDSLDQPFIVYSIFAVLIRQCDVENTIYYIVFSKKKRY
jgi:hypothetical protein